MNDDDLREVAFEFLRQADRRVDGTGDFDAYHSARHDLVMVLSGRDYEVVSDSADTGRINEDNSRPLGADSAVGSSSSVRADGPEEPAG